MDVGRDVTGAPELSTVRLAKPTKQAIPFNAVQRFAVVGVGADLDSDGNPITINHDSYADKGMLGAFNKTEAPYQHGVVVGEVQGDVASGPTAHGVDTVPPLSN